MYIDSVSASGKDGGFKVHSGCHGCPMMAARSEGREKMEVRQVSVH